MLGLVQNLHLVPSLFMISFQHSQLHALSVGIIGGVDVSRQLLNPVTVLTTRLFRASMGPLAIAFRGDFSLPKLQLVPHLSRLASLSEASGYAHSAATTLPLFNRSLSATDGSELAF